MPRTSRLTAVQDPTMKALSSLLLLPLLLLGSVAHAQGYVLSQSSQTYVPLTNGTNVTLSGSLDEGSAVVPLGFTFRYFGANYTHVSVTSNGMIELLSSATASANCKSYCYGSGLPSTSATNFVAPWWGDLEGQSASKIRYTSGAGTFALEYSNWGYYSSTSPGTFSFTVRFVNSSTTGNDRVEVAYGSHAGVGDDVAAGLQGGGQAYPFLPCSATRACFETNFPTNTLFILDEPVNPELVVNNVVVSNFQRVGPGASMDLAVTFQNYGQTDAPGVFWRAYLSKDGLLSQDDLLVYDSAVGGTALTIPRSALGGIQGATQSISIPSLPDGRYRVLVEVDSSGAVAESVETNNVSATQETYLVGVDLQADALSGAPANTGPGNNITLDLAYSNPGTDAAGNNIPFQVVLSADKSLSSNDVVVYEGTFSLSAGQVIQSQAVNFTLPLNAPGGAYYFGLVLDPATAAAPTGQVAEADETNNAVFAGSASTITQADLVLDKADLVDPNTGAPARAIYMGDTRTLSVDARNIGGADATGFNIGMVMSRDANLSLLSDWRVFDSPSTAVGGYSLSQCADISAPASCTAGSFNLPVVLPTTDRLGQPLSTGDYYFFVQLDSFDEVTEMKEDNNTKMIVGPVRLYVPSPDLVTARVQAPAASASGETIPVYRVFKNMGVQDSPAVKYRYYASVNERVTDQDVPLELVVNGAALSEGTVTLARGGQDAATDFVRLPANLAPGTYYVGAVLDTDNAVAELDEANNAGASTATMTVAAPSMRISSLQLPDGTADRPYLFRLSATGATGAVTWSATGLPPGMQLDAATGMLGGTPTLADVYAFDVVASASGRSAMSRLVLRVLTGSTELSILTRALPPVINTNQPYGTSLAAAGGRRPYAWRITSGTLPKGLVLGADGSVSGTPVTAQVQTGESTLGLEVVDANGNRASGSVKVRVVASGALVIRTLELPDAMFGSDYVADVQAVMAGSATLASPLSWSVAAGKLPPGVTLTTSLDRGLFSGKVLEAGLFSFTLQVEDASGRVDTADYVVRVFPNTFRISAEVPVSLFTGEQVALTLSSTSASPVSWRLYSGMLPPGVSLSAEGVISGIVNPEPERSVGTWNVVVLAKNSEGADSLAALGFKVVERPAAAGCSAGTGVPFGWLAVLVLGALRSRRRTAGPWVQGLGLLAALIAAVIPARALAQVSSSYSVSGPNPGTYRALTGPNAGTVIYTYDASVFTTGWVVALPFPFTFYGQSYTTVGVGLEGYLDFGQTDLSTTTNRGIPHSNSSSPNIGVAAWWDNLNDRPDNAAGPETVLSSRTFGAAPNREFVIDWSNVAFSTSASNTKFSFQVRLYEGTNRIRISYAPGSSPNTATASVGIMGGLGVGLPGLSCTTSSSGACATANYPVGKDIDFALPADLTVPSVSGDDTAYAGTLFHASALLRNGGGTPVTAQKVRFFISEDPVLDLLADAQLGETMPTDLAAGQEKQVSATVLIPQALQPGNYYLFAYADPDSTLSEPNESNNASVPLPITVGAPRADLQVVALGLTSTTATPGQTLNVSRTFSNTGNAGVTAPVKYTYLLSDNAVASYSDYPLTPAGSLATLASGGSASGTDQLVLPADLPAGRYWIGLCADYDPQANPVSTLQEISEVNNCFTASQPLVVSSGGLSLLTTSLPTATQLSPYGLVLEATGGNGTYAWTKTGGELPPGMTLSTGGLLQGTPARAGTFSFTVKVTSGADDKSQNLNLAVAPGGLPLVVVDQDVPAAEFGKAYSAALIAVGGKPPYTWTLAPNSQLPQGLALASDGKLEGRALEYRSTGNERWPFTVDMVDSAGVHAVKDLALRVVASTQLQVATPRLATAYLSRPYRAELRAIGGSGAFAWRLERFQKISQGPTEAAGEPVFASVDGDDASIPFKNATGLSIIRDNSNNRLWYLDGAPTQSGLYLLVLAVRDASGVEDRTTLSLRVSYDEALQVTTPALPDAFAGQPYSVKLTSNAAEGVAVSFSVPCLLQVVMPGNTVQCVEQVPLQLLPAGLTLASDGTITGTPEAVVVEEALPAVHSFLVQVTDGQGRYDVRSLSIRLRPERTASGCSSAGAGPAGWGGLSLVLLAFAGRRRKAVAAGLLGALAFTAAGCSQRDLCKDNNVVCEDADTCDPEDGVCKCGGVGGVVCAAGSTCDVDTNTCVSTRCENVVCAAGTACDVFDGKCKCGGTGGAECADGTQCDPVAKACIPLVDCRVTACPANQDCDAATGQCLCGAAACAAGEVCAVSTGGGRTCAPSPCAGVNCSGATVCDPTDGQCKCNGAVCGGGETCACAASAATCADSDRSCTPSTLCTDVTCAGGTSCDPLDGQCKCGGPGGPVCGTGQICALGPPPQCQGGDQCSLQDGGTKLCPAGTSCDPEDGVCKCGGRGGILCQPASGNTPAEVCVVTSASAACKRGCDPRSPDCPNSQYCFHDTLAVVSVSYCAAPTGAKVEAQACTAPAECFSQVPAPRSLHCLGLEPGQFGICRAYCDVQTGSASCSQVPRPQTCQQLPDAPSNVGYCLPQ